ncbi:hypothetical protein BGX38DRAFT_1177727 [Terfezia claveryi]|nr:hypothetical protein BGX38DRAFT_1177727 [Terfezia claveryi]
MPIELRNRSATVPSMEANTTSELSSPPPPKRPRITSSSSNIPSSFTHMTGQPTADFSDDARTPEHSAAHGSDSNDDDALQLIDSLPPTPIAAKPKPQKTLAPKQPQARKKSGPKPKSIPGPRLRSGNRANPPTTTTRAKDIPAPALATSRSKARRTPNALDDTWAPKCARADIQTAWDADNQQWATVLNFEIRIILTKCFDISVDKRPIILSSILGVPKTWFMAPEEGTQWHVMLVHFKDVRYILMLWPYN